jgi:hypothetical protein
MKLFKNIRKKIAVLVCGIGLFAGITLAKNAVLEVDGMTSCGMACCLRGFTVQDLVTQLQIYEFIYCGF